jgi:peptidoglycan/LPS O-acetylase OafA/YrhL
LGRTGADLLNHFAFINNFFAEKQKINGAYWSIAAEMQMYLFFPILFNALAGGTRRDLGMLAGAALLLGLGAAVWRDFPPNRNLYLFYLMGILAAHCREAILSASARFGGGARGAAVLAIVAYFVLHALGALHKSLIVDLVAVGAFMLLACLGARDGRRPIAALAAKVGLFSYSLYLIHEPAQQLVWQYGLRPLTDSRGWQLGGLVLASFVAIMPLAWLYYRLAERPFMHRRGG